MLLDNKSCPFLREGSFFSPRPVVGHLHNNQDSAISHQEKRPAKKSENNVDTTYNYNLIMAGDNNYLNYYRCIRYGTLDAGLLAVFCRTLAQDFSLKGECHVNQSKVRR